jgi:hypothetical protein
MASAPESGALASDDRAKRRRPTASLSRRLRRSLSPPAVVRAQERVVGRSGHRWTLDVAVRDHAGTRSILMMFDCKWHERA